MMKRLNNKVPPLKSLTPIFTEKASLKAKWTYQKEDKIEEYKDLISKTQNEMLSTMSRLHNLLNKNNIKMSLAVYPWPQQIELDVVNSKHVKMWREFCKQKCFKFIDFFPFFFDEKDKSSFLEVYKKYYFWNDPHFNADGNRIIAERLIQEF